MVLILGLVVLVLWLLGQSAASADTVSESSGNEAQDMLGGDGLDKMSEAIARFEGYYVPGSLAQRTNNPGNVGTYGGRVTSYPDAGAGWDRLHGYLRDKVSAHPEWDFYDLMRYYLTGDTMGAAGANQAPDEYADYVAHYVGADPTQPVSSIFGG